MRKTIATFALIFLSLLSLPPARAGEVIDRIVATVNGHIILQSDLNDALRYEAIMSGRSMSQFDDEDRKAVLDRLIDQELLSEQMKSASFKHASETDAATQVAEARKLYPEAATNQGWQQVLGRFGIAEKSLIAHVEAQIDSKSIEAYYRDKFVPQLKQSGGSDVPLADVSAKIREVLTQQKVSELMVSWLQSLRSESKVSIPGDDSAGQGVQTP